MTAFRSSNAVPSSHSSTGSSTPELQQPPLLLSATGPDRSFFCRPLAIYARSSCPSRQESTVRRILIYPVDSRPCQQYPPFKVPQQAVFTVRTSRDTLRRPRPYRVASRTLVRTLNSTRAPDETQGRLYGNPLRREPFPCLSLSGPPKGKEGGNAFSVLACNLTLTWSLVTVFGKTSRLVVLVDRRFWIRERSPSFGTR